MVGVTVPRTISGVRPSDKDPALHPYQIMSDWGWKAMQQRKNFSNMVRATSLWYPTILNIELCISPRQRKSRDY